MGSAGPADGDRQPFISFLVRLGDPWDRGWGGREKPGEPRPPQALSWCPAVRFRGARLCPDQFWGAAHLAGPLLAAVLQLGTSPAAQTPG